MANTPTFVFMDESSIDDEFKCSICNEPFENATSTPCDHTFCRRCIEQWLKKTSDTGPCPTCRESLSLDSDLKPANRIISNRIDRYPVKCLTCGLEGIQRGLFSNHTEKSCAKIDVSCSACDIWCPWIGPRNELNDHLQSCSYEKIRPIVEKIFAKNNHLEKQCNEQQQQITRLNEQYQIQQMQIDELMATVKLLKRSPADEPDPKIKVTITFEDLVEDEKQQNSYRSMPRYFADFAWHNAAFMPKKCAQKSFSNTGFGTALQQNRKCAVFNFGCQPLTMFKRENIFTILSFEATCAFQDNVKLTVTGRRNKTTVQSRVFTLRFSKLQTFPLGWKDIDELEFYPTDGTQLSTTTDTDRHVVLTALSFI